MFLIMLINYADKKLNQYGIIPQMYLLLKFVVYKPINKILN